MNIKKRIKERERQKRRQILIGSIGGAVLLAVLVVLLLGSGDTNQEDKRPAFDIQTNNQTVTCKKFSGFSGRYVEDGSGVPVENVAAILVTNESDRFLDLATLEYKIDGKAATFVVTGLPAGKSAWVMEQNKMTVTDESSYKYIDYTASFKSDVVNQTDKISLSAAGTMLTATNNTNENLKNVFVYYKEVHEDGNYFGGITYMIEFGDLKPGEKVTKLAGHYEAGKTEIVRIGWQDWASE